MTPKRTRWRQTWAARLSLLGLALLSIMSSAQDAVTGAELLEITYTLWPDTCLGVPRWQEVCEPISTPGYRVVLRVQGERFVIRTDALGTISRVVEGPPIMAVGMVQMFLANTLNLRPNQIEVLDVQEVLWPDACLGAPQEGELCEPAETLGYRVVLGASGARYIYHTDVSGEWIRGAPPEKTAD